MYGSGIKKFSWIIVLGLALFGASVPSASRAEVAELSILKPDGQTSVRLQVELATTPAELERGLMFRTSLPEKTGMLFFLPKVMTASFWMKNTLIPLDLLFIRQNGTIAQIHAQAIPEDLTAIRSREPVPYVLEIGGGEAAKLGINEGDHVRLSALPDSESDAESDQAQ